MVISNNLWQQQAQAQALAQAQASGTTGGQAGQGELIFDFVFAFFVFWV